MTRLRSETTRLLAARTGKDVLALADELVEIAASRGTQHLRAVVAAVAEALAGSIGDEPYVLRVVGAWAGERIDGLTVTAADHVRDAIAKRDLNVAAVLAGAQVLGPADDPGRVRLRYRRAQWADVSLVAQQLSPTSLHVISCGWARDGKGDGRARPRRKGSPAE